MIHSIYNSGRILNIAFLFCRHVVYNLLIISAANDRPCSVSRVEDEEEAVVCLQEISITFSYVCFR